MRPLNKAFAAAIMSIIMTLSSTTPALATTILTFTDVPEDNWAYSYISLSASNGWITGYGDGRFGPNENVTYAALSQMLIKAFFPAQLEAVEVAEDDPWYKAACSVADDLGLYIGVDIRTQHNIQEMVEQPVSRYEMAQILSNVMRAAGANLSPNLNTAASNTADWASIPQRYQGAVAATKATGLIAGTDAQGTFAGDKLMSRAQAAAIMVRLDELIQKGFPDIDTPVDTIEPFPAQLPAITPPAETPAPNENIAVAATRAAL